MANIQRNRKIGGTNEFETEFQLGFDDLRAIEVDDDFNTLFNAYNAGLEPSDLAVTTGKIADGAVTEVKLADGAVTRDKIADEAVTSDKIYPGSIEAAHLGSNCVSGANIIDGAISISDLDNNTQLRLTPGWNPGDASKILAIKSDGSALNWVSSPPPGGAAGGDLSGNYPNPVIKNGAMLDKHFVDNTIDAARLVNFSITSGKYANLSITTQKLAGALAGAFTSAAPVPDMINQAIGVEKTVCTFPSITTRGGRVRMYGGWGLYYTNVGTADIRYRIKRGSTTVFEYCLRITGTQNEPIPVPSFSDLPATGSYVYTITLQTFTYPGGGACTIFSLAAADNGTLWLEEL